jgi:hypothetical protein
MSEHQTTPRNMHRLALTERGQAALWQRQPPLQPPLPLRLPVAGSVCPCPCT